MTHFSKAHSAARRADRLEFRFWTAAEDRLLHVVISSISVYF